jgi:Protein of unknown function (DUF3780)
VTAKREAAKRETVGFGVPNEVDPHHMTVTIPRGRSEPVLVVEHFGLRAEVQGVPDEVERVELAREKWAAVAEELRRVLNERLKEKGLKTWRWEVGANKVERVLGKELCVLVWAIEKADLDKVPVAIKNWSGLKPEERWWLYTMTAAATGGLGDAEVGWRKALRYALTENPTMAPLLARASPPKRETRKLARTDNLSLFEQERRTP